MTSELNSVVSFPGEFNSLMSHHATFTQVLGAISAEKSSYKKICFEFGYRKDALTPCSFLIFSRIRTLLLHTFGASFKIYVNIKCLPQKNLQLWGLTKVISSFPPQKSVENPPPARAILAGHLRKIGKLREKIVYEKREMRKD
jgi:hypothetical protein